MFGTRPFRRTVKPVLQTADSDCAPTCLAMILGAFGLNVSLAQVREVIDPGRDGATGTDLREAARAFDIRATAIRLRPETLVPSSAGLPTPFIAHWDNHHFVVVERIRKRTIDVVDPAIGRRRLGRSEFLESASGVVLLFQRDRITSPAGTPTVAAQAGPIASVLLPLIRRHRARLALTVVMSLVLAILGLTVPAATALITNSLAAGESPSLAWLLMAPLLAAAMGILALIRGLGAATLQRGISQDLTIAVAHRMFASAYKYFERRSTGDLYLRIASADLLRELLGVALVGSLLDSILAAGYLGVLLWLDPLLAAVTAATLVAQLALVLVLTSKARTQHREELLAAADADSLIVDAIAGVASIRTSASEAAVLQRWAGYFNRRLDAATRRSRTSAAMEAVTTMSQLGAPILFLFVAAIGAQSPGLVLGLAALAGAVLAPLTSLSNRLVGLAELNPLLERILDVMNAPRERGADPAHPTARITGRIELAGAGFRYDIRSPFVFRDIDLVIAAGTKVAVVGPSGCGKSTLLSVLTGLHELTQGHVLFDGQDIAALDLPSLRRQIGVVLQDTYLGIGTIREAITLGRSDVSDQEIHRATMMAAIYDEIVAMPLGFDTRVIEGGRGVSGGQRQRIALARALLGSPAVLILDEATSALDAETEAMIENNLRGLAMTRIVIAHRLSTVADADMVLVLNDGRFVEAGSPGELLQRGGQYAALVAAQNGGSSQVRRPLPVGMTGHALPGGRHRAADQGPTVSAHEGALGSLHAGARHLRVDHQAIDDMDLRADAGQRAA